MSLAPIFEAAIELTEGPRFQIFPNPAFSTTGFDDLTGNEVISLISEKSFKIRLTITNAGTPVNIGVANLPTASMFVKSQGDKSTAKLELAGRGIGSTIIEDDAVNGIITFVCPAGSLDSYYANDFDDEKQGSARISFTLVDAAGEDVQFHDHVNVEDQDYGNTGGNPPSAFLFMDQATYDPTLVAADAFARANHTGTQAATTVSNVPSGSLVATEQQAVNDEISLRIDNLPDAMEYKGSWNATTNTPTLIDGTGDLGDYYKVSVAGTQDLGGGSVDYEISDSLIYSGTIWEHFSHSGEQPDIATQTIIGRDTAGTGQREVLTPSVARGVLELENVDNTTDLLKPLSTAYIADRDVAQFNADRINGTTFDAAGISNGFVYAYNSVSGNFELQAQGGAALSVAGFSLNMDLDVTASEPASGGIKFDTATIGSVTIIRASTTDANGVAIGIPLSSLGASDLFFVPQADDPSKFLLVSVVSSALVTTSYNITCTVVSSGTLMGSGKACAVQPMYISGGGGLPGLTSFNGRTAGAAAPAAGDYTTAQVTNTSAVTGATDEDALNTLNNDKAEDSITVTGANGCSGGGDLSANREISLDLTSVNSWTGQQVIAEASPAFAASFTWLMDTQATCNLGTITANLTVTLSEQVAGGTYYLRTIQGGAGGYTTTITGATFPNGAPDTSLDAIGGKRLYTCVYAGGDFVVTYTPEYT